MKITKRQLKRIIREEYSRLKENQMNPMVQRYIRTIDEFIFDAGEADMFEIEDALEMNQGSVDPSLMAQALQVMERDGAIVQDDYGIYRLSPDSEGSF